jgi:hypothetical protein
MSGSTELRCWLLAMTLTSLSVNPAARKSRAALAASETVSKEPTTVLTM